MGNTKLGNWDKKMDFYKLALKLKRAGFPQLKNGAGIHLLSNEFLPNGELNGEMAYWPTLDELKANLPKEFEGGMFPEEAFAYAYIAEKSQLELEALDRLNQLAGNY